MVEMDFQGFTMMVSRMDDDFVIIVKWMIEKWNGHVPDVIKIEKDV